MIAQIHENAPKIALELFLFIHVKTETHQSELQMQVSQERAGWDKKIPHKYTRCPVFAGAACLLKMHEKKPRSPSGNPQLPIFLPY